MRCKNKTATPLRYEVLNKDTLKSKILPHLPAENHGKGAKK